MNDALDSSVGDEIPQARAAAADGIPMARPITLPCSESASPPRPDDMLLATMSRGAAWADVGLLVLCVIAVDAVFGAITAFGVGLWSESEPWSESARLELNHALMLPALVARTVGTLLIVVMLSRRRGQSLRSMGVRLHQLVLNVLIGGAAAIVVGVATICIMSLLALLWPGLLDQMGENKARILDMLPRFNLLGLLGVATLIGLYEEVLFRGFLMTRLRRATGGWVPAVLLSTALFTIPHAIDQVPAALISIAILSLTFSVVMIWRRSIIPVVVAHALFDFAMFLILFLDQGQAST